MTTDRQKILDAILDCPEDVFRGATRFVQLSFSERLDWLAEAARTVQQLKGLANQPTDRDPQLAHKIEKGMRQKESSQTVSHEEAKERFAKWLK